MPLNKLPCTCFYIQFMSFLTLLEHFLTDYQLRTNWERTVPVYVVCSIYPVSSARQLLPYTQQSDGGSLPIVFVRDQVLQIKQVRPQSYWEKQLILDYNPEVALQKHPRIYLYMLYLKRFFHIVPNHVCISSI